MSKAGILLFPGQGAQVVGMGKAIAAVCTAAIETFQEADEVLGFGLSVICFEGPIEALSETEVTQPALLATSVAVLRACVARGLRCEAAAGHSVGEYAALVAVGSITFGDALRLVRRRGELMAQAAALTPGTMAAIIGLDVDEVNEICTTASDCGVVEPSNINAPTQIVISGQFEAVDRAITLAQAAGAKAIRLNVSAPFHCSLMTPVKELLRPDIEAMEIQTPRVPVVANSTATFVRTPTEIREALLDQLAAPVRWTESMDILLAMQPRRFVEVGPGRVLAGLMRNIDRSVSVVSVATPETIELLMAEEAS